MQYAVHYDLVQFKNSYNTTENIKYNFQTGITLLFCKACKFFRVTCAKNINDIHPFSIKNMLLRT